MYRLLDLFSGIGGFSLGLERSGNFRTVAFCEIEPYCRWVLKKHWPNVKCYGDIRKLTADILRSDGIAVDAICGGFPCQDISFAGKGAGLDGERSGLWREFARLIGELRPRYVFVENVAALLGRGLGTVLGDLAAFGYDAEWHCIPAAAVGAPHRRDRVWIIAYSYTDGVRSQRVWTFASGAWREQQFEGLLQDTLRTCVPTGRIGGMVDGVPHRVDRLKGLGNAVVPQIPEILGATL
jgi:DNA (cytosine-5)-methyltransferase 1